MTRLPTNPRVEIVPPDIAPYADSACGIPYLHVLDSGKPGPTAMISAVVHGNELCGAVVLDRLLRDGFRPACGRLTLAFMNVDAYCRFDPADPAASRFVERDFNRVWEDALLDGPEDGPELRRARAVRAAVGAVDYLLDLHSTSSHSPPMVLTGLTPRTTAFAASLGVPHALVRDAGHAEGRRMRDYTPFSDPNGGSIALLAECGQHWLDGTAETARSVAQRFLHRLGMAADGPPSAPPGPQLEVTEAVTAQGENFLFAEDYQGLERIERAGTEIARDGEETIRTPYDGCVLVMPTHGARAGQTAVRLAREMAPA
jgi:predicted deacylase